MLSLTLKAETTIYIYIYVNCNIFLNILFLPLLLSNSLSVGINGYIKINALKELMEDHKLL